jgi:hypothetical protein
MELITPEYALLIWTIVIITVIGFWLFALIDILRHQFRGNYEKLIWVLVVLFLPILGSILYFIIGRSHRIKYNH